MKLKIKVKVLTIGCCPRIRENGDWIDLYSAVDATLYPAQSGTLKRRTEKSVTTRFRDVEMQAYAIPLGVAMELPKGFEAVINSRSSGPSKLGLFIPSGQGVIDNSYRGDEDEWKYVCSPMREVDIRKGDRICQFRIQLSQKATMWQKLKWLFSSGIEIKTVNHLGNPNRGGIGSSGVR